MILTALMDVAKSEKLVPVESYEPIPVRFLVTIGTGGEYRGVNDTSVRTGNFLRSAIFMCPKRSLRTSGDLAEFLVDKAEYVFGWPERPKQTKDTAKTLARAKKRHELYLDQVHKALESSECQDDRGILALKRFLTSPEVEKLRLEVPEDWADGDMWAFMLDCDPEGPRLICDSPAVVEYWIRVRPARDDKGEGTELLEKPARNRKVQLKEPGPAKFHCVITNELCEPIRLHPPIGGVPPTRDTGRGAPLTSIDKASEAFESYGLKEFACAPVSRRAADLYQTALQRLLDPSYLNPVDGSPLPRRCCQLSEDTTIVFWAENTNLGVDLFAEAAFDADPEAVRALFDAPWYGAKPALSDAQHLYALTVSGAKGRTTIRAWAERPINEAIANLKQFFTDMSLDSDSQGVPGAVPLKRALLALVHGKDDKKRAENLPKELVTVAFESIFMGRTLPYSLFGRAIQRTKLDRPSNDRDEFNYRERRRYRTALIKAYLMSKRRQEIRDFAWSSIPEIKPMLDENCTESSYHLGRLFAVLEQMQKEATKAKAGIRERFYGAASATPAAVFSGLIRKSQHHLSKSKRPGFYKKLLNEIYFKIPAQAFPPTLELSKQGLFALGYYHESTALFDPNINSERNLRFLPKSKKKEN